MTNKAFRYPYWVFFLAALSTAAFLCGAILIGVSQGATWLSFLLGALALMSALGATDARLSQIRLTDEALEIFSNFRMRRHTRPEITEVAWSAGCPVSVRVGGAWIHLPPLADSRVIASCIREWIKKPGNGIENDFAKIDAARQAASEIAAQIANGELDAYEGAMRIWKQVIDHLESPIPDDLWPFKSNASAIEDCLWDSQESGTNHDALIAQCKEEILRASRQLIATEKTD